MHRGLATVDLIKRGPVVSGGAHLLCAHATGFCKEVWRPVVSEIVTECSRAVAFDFRGHGASSRFGSDDGCSSAAAPLSWWDFGRDAAFVAAQMRRDKLPQSPLVGVGHSKGATALVLAELLAPGTFDSLILVEPILFPRALFEGGADGSENPMVASTARRRPRWESRAAAQRYFRERSVWQDWDDRAMAEYVEHGLTSAAAEGEGGEEETAEGGSAAVALRCDPAFEASIYGLGYSAWERLSEITCPVRLVVGAESHHLDGVGALLSSDGGGNTASYYRDVVAPLFGTPSPPVLVVPGGSHFVTMEQPAVIAAEVEAALRHFDSMLPRRAAL